VALPEDDLPPVWLRDYGVIEADIGRMEEFAAGLRAEVTGNYAPHLAAVYDDILVGLQAPATGFAELRDFLHAYRESTQLTADVTYFYQDATGGFATAAETVSARYRSSDAFASARLDEVVAALDKTSAAARPAARPTAAGPAVVAPEVP
jgi:hypothetical protein